MNRREAILAGVASIATVAVPARSAQGAGAENQDLQPILAVLDAYDKAFTNQDLDGVMASLSDKATIMGTGPGEIWSGPDEIKGAYKHFFGGFDKGQQRFDYEYNIGRVTSGTAWLMTSGNVNGKKDGNAFTFPVNVSLTLVEDAGKWLIAAMHFSILTAQNE
jgi:ketosteroid isomerase-like protein